MTTWRRALLATTALLIGLQPMAAAGAPKPPATTTTVPPGQIVESWALAPAASSGSPDEPGNRPFLSYSLDPGAVVDDAVTVFNYSTVPMSFRLYATDAFNNADGAFDLLPADQKPKDLGTWITLPTEGITLDPGKQATVPISVHVPADAKPGDHAGAILASSGALGTGPDGKVVQLDRRTGSRVYLRVNGPLEPRLSIKDVSVHYTPSLNPLGGTARISYRIQNEGNVRLGGRYQASVSGPFGIASKRGPRHDLEELLPGEGLTVEETFHNVPAAVIERAKVSLDPASDAGGSSDLPARRRSGMGLAPPITVILLMIAGWLVLRSRRAYRRHQQESPAPTAPVRQPERV